MQNFPFLKQQLPYLPYENNQESTQVRLESICPPFEEDKRQQFCKDQKKELSIISFNSMSTASTNGSQKNKMIQKENEGSIEEDAEEMNEEEDEEADEIEEEEKEEDMEEEIEEKQEITNNQDQNNKLRSCHKDRKISFAPISNGSIKDGWSTTYLNYDYKSIKEIEQYSDTLKNAFLESLNFLLNDGSNLKYLYKTSPENLKEMMFYEKRLCSILYFFSFGIFNKKFQKQIHNSRINGKSLNPKLICACGKIYKNESGIKNHIKKHHPGISKSYLQIQTSQKFGANSGFKSFQIDREISDLLKQYLIEMHGYQKCYLETIDAEGYFN